MGDMYYNEGVNMSKEKKQIDESKMYLFSGYTFLLAAVLFMFSQTTSMWVVFFTLGMTFIIISSDAREKRHKAEQENNLTVNLEKSNK